MFSLLSTLQEIREEPGCFPEAIFRLPTGDGREAFMKVRRTPFGNQERMIVEVDSGRFLKLWMPERWASSALGQREAWEADDKYPRAAERFSHGRANPVPLAKANAREYPAATSPSTPAELGLCTLFRRRSVSMPPPTADRCPGRFTDGTTRTMWLMANKVEMFPIECNEQESARLLQQHAGVGTPTRSVDQLLPLPAGDRHSCGP
jgi:hypothetical protein